MSARDPQATSGSTAGYAEKPRCVCVHGEVFHVLRDKGRGPCGATVTGASGVPVRCPCLAYRPQRLSTPDRKRVDEDGRTVTRITTQRVCNGCNKGVGDATEEEIVAGQLGRALPDATQDCPACWAAEHLPTAKPLTRTVAQATAEKPARTDRGARRG